MFIAAVVTKVKKWKHVLGYAFVSCELGETDDKDVVKDDEDWTSEGTTTTKEVQSSAFCSKISSSNDQ